MIVLFGVVVRVRVLPACASASAMSASSALTRSASLSSVVTSMPPVGSALSVQPLILLGLFSSAGL